MSVKKMMCTFETLVRVFFFHEYISCLFVMSCVLFCVVNAKLRTDYMRDPSAVDAEVMLQLGCLEIR